MGESTKQRAGIYLRLSRDDGRAGEANSIAGQRADCLAYAERNGWVATEFVEDEAVSASKGLERPAYMAMLDAMSAGQLDHVIAAKQDRYTRDRDVEWGQLARLAQATGVHVHTADSGDLRLHTPDGALSAGLRSEFSAFEARLIGARTRRGLRTRREAGEWTSSGRTYGYFKGGTVNPEQAEHIRWAYDQILNHGKTARDVFDRWRANGVLTVNGKPWTNVGRVASMLRNPVLSSRVFYKGEYLRRGKWEAIVAPEEQDRLSMVISAQYTGARGYGQRRPRKRFLAGLMLCGNPECDLLPMVSQNPSNGRGYYYWHCDRRRGGCGNRVRGDAAESLAKLVASFLYLYEEPPEVQSVWDDTEMRKIERQLAEVREALASNAMRASDAVPVLNRLNERLAEQQAAKDAHEARRKAVEDWHLARRESVLSGDDTDAVRAILDNVRVLPSRGGYVFEARNGRTVPAIPNALGEITPDFGTSGEILQSVSQQGREALESVLSQWYEARDRLLP